MTQAARLLEDFYPEHVISRLSKSEQEFWEDRHLEVNDWQGISQISEDLQVSGIFFQPNSSTMLKWLKSY